MLDDHADAIHKMIEEELIHKMHVEHELDREGRSPYGGRSDGLPFRQADAPKFEDTHPNDRNKALRSVKLVAQQVKQLC